MQPAIRVNWLSQQMFSPTRPIGREQIFGAFAAVLSAVTGVAAGEPEKIAEQELPGLEFLGYWAAVQTFRIAAGEGSLICVIDPITASMGVSGEQHSWRSEGLQYAVTIGGSALSSARQPSWAELRIDGVEQARAAELEQVFAGAFPELEE